MSRAGAGLGDTGLGDTALGDTALGAGDRVRRSGARLPPVAQLAAGSLALIVVGGIYMAAGIGQHESLVPAVGLLAGSAVLVSCAAALLARVPSFAWARFWQVARWALLVYLISAGMLEYVFAYDHTPGRELVLLTLMLAVYAVDIPLLLAFTVARYQPVPELAGR
ncbi:MAG: hypothetical protein ACRDYD_07705 [Acidimicrobiales bacterium]